MATSSLASVTYCGVRGTPAAASGGFKFHRSVFPARARHLEHVVDERLARELHPPPIVRWRAAEEVLLLRRRPVEVAAGDHLPHPDQVRLGGAPVGEANQAAARDCAQVFRRVRLEQHLLPHHGVQRTFIQPQPQPAPRVLRDIYRVVCRLLDQFSQIVGE